LSRFDAVALAESKRALDIVPGSISGWRQAFSYGMAINTGIRTSSSAQWEGFSRFAAGERNLGQEERAGCPIEPIQDRLDSGRA